MLPIIVKGKGLIPRGHGIAPKLFPFPASIQLIRLILNTKGLSVEFVDPETNTNTPINNSNLEKIYENYDKKLMQKRASAITLSYSKPSEEKKEESSTIETPIEPPTTPNPVDEIPPSDVNVSNTESINQKPEQITTNDKITENNPSTEDSNNINTEESVTDENNSSHNNETIMPRGNKYKRY
jgi:hypothetical protein